MKELTFFNALLGLWFGVAGITFLLLLFISAPYGRHIRKGWGWEIPSPIGWLVMELPAVVVPLILFGVSTRKENPVLIVFLLLWQLHYVFRTFVYPFRMRMRGKTMPISIASMAFFTNIGINYLNARWLFTLGPTYSTSWLVSPQFIVGCLLFFLGYAIHFSSDTILRDLRKPGETGYKVPQGGGYRWVSSPNYLGEILEWTGWALMTWSLPGLLFALWTASNLIPRARENHKWYRKQFKDYPSERKALIPWLW